MGVGDEMREKLTTAFAPNALDIIDESEQHRGHAGFQEGGESHWRITISAPAFADMTRLERHRAVHDALGPDIVGRIHALALKISA
ncbi:MAG: BolA family protein [Pseudomonadota bacterium]